MSRLEKSIEYVSCKLTDAELKNYSELMADAVRKHSRADANLKSVTKAIKSELQTLEGQIDLYAEKINSKAEYRDVECRIEWDFKSGEKRYVRADTGEVVKTEMITEIEKQEELAVQDRGKRKLPKGAESLKDGDRL